MKKQYNAFTLIELLIVMAVIVILMGIGLLGGRFVIKRAHKTEHQAILADLVKATESYNLDNAGYPEVGPGHYDTFSALMADYENAKYLDHPFDDTHGQAATFYYVVSPVNDSYYFCAENTADNYVVCDGPDAPSPADAPDTSAGNVISSVYN